MVRFGALILFSVYSLFSFLFLCSSFSAFCLDCVCMYIYIFINLQFHFNFPLSVSLCVCCFFMVALEITICILYFHSLLTVNDGTISHYIEEAYTCLGDCSSPPPTLLCPLSYSCYMYYIYVYYTPHRTVSWLPFLMLFILSWRSPFPSGIISLWLEELPLTFLAVPVR